MSTRVVGGIIRAALQTCTNKSAEDIALVSELYKKNLEKYLKEPILEKSGVDSRSKLPRDIVRSTSKIISTGASKNDVKKRERDLVETLRTNIERKVKELNR